nr:MAG TPA: hypothetical protein [Caudoviricetes sp.]
MDIIKNKIIRLYHNLIYNNNFIIIINILKFLFFNFLKKTLYTPGGLIITNLNLYWYNRFIIYISTFSY